MKIIECGHCWELAQIRKRMCLDSRFRTWVSLAHCVPMIQRNVFVLTTQKHTCRLILNIKSICELLKPHRGHRYYMACGIRARPWHFHTPLFWKNVFLRFPHCKVPSGEWRTQKNNIFTSGEACTIATVFFPQRTRALDRVTDLRLPIQHQVPFWFSMDQNATLRIANKVGEM